VREDSIQLEGLVFYGYHGVQPAEAELGQPFVVDLALMLPLRPAGLSDDLRQTVDYGDVYHTVKQVVEGERCHLLEAVAERVAAALLARYPLRAVQVRVNKPQAPIKGATFSRIAVQITRARDEEPPAS
jgi:7,8-dihydroneopterin aldolase/epimerase/oxygenase